MDAIVNAPNKRTLQDFAIKHNLGVMTDDGFQPNEGFKSCFWGGDGKFKTKNGTYDDEGNELTAPTYLSGVVAIMRFTPRFRINVTKTIDGEQVVVKVPDAIEVDPEADNTEQHKRSRIVAFIRNKGVKGKTGTINHWRLDGVKLLRPKDVMDFVEANGLAPHTRSGGNQF